MAVIKKTDYKINNFIIYSVSESNLILMNNKGIVKISEPRLIICLKKWDEQGIKYLNDNELDIFDEDKESLIDFMKANHIIIEEKSNNHNISEIFFITNNKKIFALAEQNLFEKALGGTALLFNEHSEIENIIDKENALYIIFLNPYSKKIAAHVQQTIESLNGSLMLMTYTYNNNFYMDSLYFPYLNNPCHLCHIGHIESQLRVGFEGQLSYQQVIDSIYFEDKFFAVETILTSNSLLNILTLISNKVSRYIFFDFENIIYPHELHQCLMLDLQTNKIFQDYSLHWELCDCYE